MTTATASHRPTSTPSPFELAADDRRRDAMAPPRSLQQRMEALERANEFRSKRAELKRDLKAGRKAAAPLIVEPPEWLETMKLYDLILALPKYGRVKANKILSQMRISPSKTIGGLSSRQRAEVVGYLNGGPRPFAPSPWSRVA